MVVAPGKYCDRAGNNRARKLLIFPNQMDKNKGHPGPNACSMIKWLAINIPINQILKMEKIVREKFERGQSLDKYSLGTTSTT